MTLIDIRPYGTTSDGKAVNRFVLRNRSGMESHILDYGGIVRSLLVPNAAVGKTDVVLGFDSLKEYESNSPYFGCIVGRYANRIARGRFTLDGRQYQLPCNLGKHHIHGGFKGFGRVLWKAEVSTDDDLPVLHLSYTSPDGEEGYPGNLDVAVRYSLTDGNELAIEYQAHTDRPTIVNLTNHSYFNLAGAGSGEILDHELEISGEAFLVTDVDQIPTGEIKTVAGTPMDFRTTRRIGDRIDDNYEQLRIAGGYDHAWLVGTSEGSLQSIASLGSARSGISMTVQTTEPSVQIYTANGLSAGTRGKNGAVYGPRTGICLEAQHFPNSPNITEFPSTVLEPEETYYQKTVFSFSHT